MATYEDDHNLPASSTSEEPKYRRRARPDLTNFFSTLSLDHSSSGGSSGITTHGPTTSHIPTTAYASLAQAWQSTLEGNEIIESLIEQLLSESESGKEGQGVSQEFLDGLERIPKKELVEADTCPICNTPFLVDKYPLVVRLPCHRSHAFDLECISPWLKLHTTCPLDRIDVTKKKTPPPMPPADEEEDWDENYG